MLLHLLSTAPTFEQLQAESWIKREILESSQKWPIALFTELGLGWFQKSRTTFFFNQRSVKSRKKTRPRVFFFPVLKTGEVVFAFYS